MISCNYNYHALMVILYVTTPSPSLDLLKGKYYRRPEEDQPDAQVLYAIKSGVLNAGPSSRGSGQSCATEAGRGDRIICVFIPRLAAVLADCTSASLPGDCSPFVTLRY